MIPKGPRAKSENRFSDKIMRLRNDAGGEFEAVL